MKMIFSRNSNKGRAKARGFTLVELALTVGAVMVLSLAGYKVYKAIVGDSDVKQQIDGITDFVKGSKQTFGLVGGSWAQFTAANLIKMNRIPPQFSKDASKIYDAFRNEVTFGAATATEGVVSFTMRSPEECSAVTQAVASLVYAAAVGAAGSETPVKTGTTELSIADMATGCETAGRVLKLTLR